MNIWLGIFAIISDLYCWFSGTNIGEFESNGLGLVCSKSDGKKRKGDF